MGSMKLYSEGPLSVTSISNCFIDEYMPEANGEFVKVYLYLLRCMGDASMSCSVSAIADHLNHTEKDIMRALNYWHRQNVLGLDFDANKKLVGIKLLPLMPMENYARMSQETPLTITAAPSAMPDMASTYMQAVSATAAATAATSASAGVSASATTGSSHREYSAAEIDSFRADPEVSEIFYIIETYLKKPLKTTDINTVLFWYEELEFTSDLITYLVEYSISRGHTSFHYMDKIAMDWHTNGIFTIEAAKASAEAHNKVNYSIIKAMGISGRDLAASEKNTISRWTNDWHFELPLIEEACRRTIEATHQASFNYADKVLETWKDNNVKNLEDVKALDLAHSKKHQVNLRPQANVKQNRFNQFEQRNNDYDAWEQGLFKTQLQ